MQWNSISRRYIDWRVWVRLAVGCAITGNISSGLLMLVGEGWVDLCGWFIGPGCGNRGGRRRPGACALLGSIGGSLKGAGALAGTVAELPSAAGRRNEVSCWNLAFEGVGIGGTDCWEPPCC